MTLKRRKVPPTNQDMGGEEINADWNDNLSVVEIVRHLEDKRKSLEPRGESTAAFSLEGRGTTGERPGGSHVRG